MYYLEIANLLFTFYMLIQLFFYPESPRYNYSKEKFQDSKDGLKQVDSFNSNKNYTSNFKYDTEKEIE